MYGCLKVSVLSGCFERCASYCFYRETTGLYGALVVIS